MKGTRPLDNDEIRRVSTCFTGTLGSFSFKKLSGFTPSFLELARFPNLAYRVGRVKKHEKYSRI